MPGEYFGGYFAPSYFTRNYFGGTAADVQIIRGDPDAGLGPRKWRWKRELDDFIEAVEAIEPDRPETVSAAITAFHKAEMPEDVARKIDAALKQMVERQKGHMALARRIEGWLATMRRRRDETALMVLI